MSTEMVERTKYSALMIFSPLIRSNKKFISQSAPILLIKSFRATMAPFSHMGKPDLVKPTPWWAISNPNKIEASSRVVLNRFCSRPNHPLRNNFWFYAHSSNYTMKNSETCLISTIKTKYNSEKVPSTVFSSKIWRSVQSHLTNNSKNILNKEAKTEKQVLFIIYLG